MLHRPELFGLGSQYIVEAGDTLCNLAHRYYGNPHLWWAIASANGIEDPTIEPAPGSSILIPNYSDVLRVIAQ
ncbi:MAG: LysM peptidoglycan-binding domain-containing protein [Patescibacteria group bacterium]